MCGLAAGFATLVVGWASEKAMAEHTGTRLLVQAASHAAAACTGGAAGALIGSRFQALVLSLVQSSAVLLGHWPMAFHVVLPSHRANVPENPFGHLGYLTDERGQGPHEYFGKVKNPFWHDCLTTLLDSR